MIEPKHHIEHHQSIEEQKEFKKVGIMKLKKGLTLFELDRLTGKVCPVNLDSHIQVKTNGKTQKRHKFVPNPKNIYVQALNKKNAIRKIKKEFGLF